MNRETSIRRRQRIKNRRRLQIEQVEMRCLLAVGLPGLISVDSTGSESGNASSSISRQSLSGDGRFEVFTSAANNLVAGITDTNGTEDVFVRDTTSGATKLVSAAISGTTGNGTSDQPAISADGRFVAFRSHATDLGTVDNNNSADVFIWERTTGNIVLASTNSDGDDGGNGDSSVPSISGDGSIVAFVSDATDLVAEFVNNNGADADVFVRDVAAAATALVSSDLSGTATADSFSFGPIVSKDGSTVVFESRSSNLVTGVIDVNGTDDVFAYDVATGTKEALSVATPGIVSGDNGSMADLRQTTSDDGRFHVFTSQATDLDADIIDSNNTNDVFLFDTVSGVATLISATPSGQSGSAASDQPVISADGNFVAFRSTATDLGTADSNSSADIFLWNRSTGAVSLVSPNADGSDGGNSSSFEPSISGDGSIVAFVSLATDLVDGIDTSASISDIYVRRTVEGTTALASSNRVENAVGNHRSFHPIVSEDSSTVVFESLASDLVVGVGDSNDEGDIYAYVVATGDKEAISVRSELIGTISGDRSSARWLLQAVSDDGRFHVYTSGSTNLDPAHAIANGANNVYLFDAVTGTNTLVSVTPDGKAGNGFSDQPVLSADGNFVAFRSKASDLDPADNNEHTDVFLWERTTGHVTLLSANATGGEEGDSETFRPSISGDGSLVAFASTASNLVDGILDVTPNGFDVFYHDVSAGTTYLVSGNLAGNASGNSQSIDPIVSDDGSTIVFKSLATDLVDGVVDGNFKHDLFAFDVSSGSIEILTLEFDGDFSGNGTSETTQRQTSSDDGRYHVYTSEAYNLDSNAVDTRLESVYLYDAVTRTSTLVSTTPMGVLTDGVSDQPVISADGNFVAFRSTTTNFGSVDADQNEDIYLWERATGAITLISINQDGTAGGNHDSQNPSISGDGSVIAFQSRATDLVAGITDTNNSEDVFVRSVNSGQTALASSNDTETATGDSFSIDPIVSEDSSSVIFVSNSSNMVAGVTDGNNDRDVFAYDIISGAKEVISLEVAEGISGNAQSYVGIRQSISGDGRFHVFTSRASNLAPGIVDANDQDDVYLYDAILGTTSLVSITPQGTSGNTRSDQPVISDDGNFVAFRSFGGGFGPTDNNGTTDVYLYNRITASVSLVSESITGDSGNSRSFTPSISGDGSIISFTSEASDLVSGITNPSLTDNIFVRNASLGTTALASSNQSGGSTGNQDSADGIVSQDGSTVVFESRASDLVPGINDANLTVDVFTYDVATGTKENLSLDPIDNTSGGGFSPDVNDDGTKIVFASRDKLSADDNNGETDVYLVNRVVPSIELVSINETGTNSGSGDSENPRISGDGNVIVFESRAEDLASPDSNSGLDIFLRNLSAATTELISVNHDGTDGAGALGVATLSDDGRFVAFHSASTNLVTVPTTGGGLQHVFLRDTTTQQTILVDKDNIGSTDANYQSFHPVISADGSRVVFDTNAARSLDGNFTDLNGVVTDVYSHRVDDSDISLGTNDLVSRKSPGVRVTGSDNSWQPSVSDNGRFVTFASSSNFLTNLPSLSEDIYVRDRVSQTTEMISTNGVGTAGGNFGSRISQISGDGNTVVFQSSANDLTAGDTNSGADIYVRNRVTGITRLISVDGIGGNATGNATDPSISDDGRFVAFMSAAPAAIGGVSTTFGIRNIVLRDTVTDQSKLITVDTDGNESGGTSPIPALAPVSVAPYVNGNGTSVVFWTEASNLIDSGFVDINYAADVYIHDINQTDILMGANEIVSHKAASFAVTPAQGLTSIDGPFPYDLNDDGSIIVFNSDGNAMVPNDVNFRDDIYLVDRSSNQLELISEATTGLAAGAESEIPRISGNGQVVVYTSKSSELTSTPTSGITNVFAYDRSLGTTEMISRNIDGDHGGNDHSDLPSISDDGRFIGFHSEATDLVGDSIATNSQRSSFLHDRLAGKTALISIDVSGTVDGNRRSNGGAVSANGKTVTFSSQATNLVGTDFIDINGPGSDDVYLHEIDSDDISNGINRIISRMPMGIVFTGDRGSIDPDVSDDGQSIVFESRADFLTLHESVSDNRDIFIRDRSTDTTELVSVSRFGNRGANRSSGTPRISGDGNSVLFDSRATDLVSNSVSSSFDDIFLRNISSGTTELISVDHSGGGADSNSAVPSISDDGRFVAFHSFARDLTPSGVVTGFALNVFLRDTVNDQTALISSNFDGTADANGLSINPSVSGNGKRILFSSSSTDLLGSSIQDVNGSLGDVFSHLIDPSDISLGTNQLVSAKAAGPLKTGDGRSGDPDVSDDGQLVAFESFAQRLAANDSNSNADVFVRDRSSQTTLLVSSNASGTGSGNLDSGDPRISGNGNSVVFVSLASDLTSIDSGNQQNVFVRDLGSVATELISVNRDGDGGGNADSLEASISDNGRFVTFTSIADNLTPIAIATASRSNVYFRDRQESSVEIVSRKSTGTANGNGDSFAPSISDNGVAVTFQSDATDLVTLIDSNVATDVFVALTGVTDLAIVARDANLPEGNDGATPYTFVVTRNGDVSESAVVDVNLFGSGANPADADDFDQIVISSEGTPFSNQALPMDVTNDGIVNIDDIWAVIGILYGSPSSRQATLPEHLVDPSGDGKITALDAQLINQAIITDHQPPTINVHGATYDGVGRGQFTIHESQSVMALTADQTGITQVIASVDGGPAIDLPVGTNGSFSFKPADLMDPTRAGDHTISLIAVDGRGQASDPQLLSFSMTSSLSSSMSPIMTESIMFAAGETSKLVTVFVNGDVDFEADEGFVVQLVDQSGELHLSQPTADGLIINDDISDSHVEQIIYFNRDADAEKDIAGDGTGQRSIIRQIQVTFSGPLDVAVGPVVDDSFVVESIDLATMGTEVGLEVLSSTLVNGKQIIVLGFVGAELIEDSSENQPGILPMIEDGRYRLKINGNSLGTDSNGDDAGLDVTDDFFRMFGDSDGDGDVDSIDIFRLRPHWINGAGGAIFDYDDDDQSQDIVDLIQFFARYGQTINGN